MDNDPRYGVLFHNDRHETIDETFDSVSVGIDKALEVYRDILTDPNLKSAEIVILANHQDDTILLEDVVINKQNNGQMSVEGGGWLIEPSSQDDSIALYDHLSRNFDFKVSEVWAGQTPEQMELEPRYIELGNGETIELHVKGAK